MRHEKFAARHIKSSGISKNEHTPIISYAHYSYSTNASNQGSVGISIRAKANVGCVFGKLVTLPQKWLFEKTPHFDYLLYHIHESISQPLLINKNLD